MSRKFKLLSVVMTFLFAISIVDTIGDVEVNAAGNIYYVDDIGGDDSNDGLSQGNAFRTLDKVNTVNLAPGDQLLFKTDGIWSGQLLPKGSGSLGSPITIGSYGNGAKPLIAGGGADNTIYLYNQEYIEIKDLEITNWTTEIGLRSGIKIEAKDAGTLSHIYIKNVDVHDIKTDYINSEGNRANNMIGNGGIIFKITGNTVPTKWDDILVEGCTLYNIQYYGINLNSSYTVRDGVSGAFELETGIPDEECSDYYPSTNIVIKDNYLYRIGNGMITPNVCDGVLIKNNICQEGNAYYAGNVPIWWTVSDNVVVENNEIFDTKLPTHGDASAIDSDLSTYGALVQYNYSHNNAGGFFLWCSWDGLSPAKDVTIRYNISQNDRQRIFWMSNVNNAGGSGNKIYNNTIFMSDNAAIIGLWNEGPTDPTWFEFKNNIFYSQGDQGWPSDVAVTVDNNAYFGGNAFNANDMNAITGDPGLLAPGMGRIGMNVVDGYKLTEGSPCLGTGTLIADNGGLDYYGNPVSATLAPNVGAYNGAAVAARPNIAMNKAVSAISEESAAKAASKAADSNIATMWVAASGDANNWWKVDLGSDYDISGSEITFNTSEQWKYIVEVSTDDQLYTTVIDKSNNIDLSKTQEDQYSATGRYIRVTVTETPGTNWTAIKEFRAFGTEVQTAVDYYTIKNRWTGDYMSINDASGYVGYKSSTSPSTDYSLQWSKEYVDGYVRYKNRQTGLYMNVQNQSGNVECTDVPSAYWSGHWSEVTSEGYTRLVERWHDLAAHVESQSGYVQYGDLPSTYWSGQWTVSLIE